MPAQDRLDYLAREWNALRPDIDISPWRVWGRITRIHEIFVGRVGRRLSKHGLTYKEFQTLGALMLAQPPHEASPTEIARFNLLTSGGLANMLARLEASGFLERRPDIRDRRGVIVSLSERGVKLFNDAVAEENQLEHEMIAALSPEESEMLSILLRKLLLSIDAVYSR